MQRELKKANTRTRASIGIVAGFNGRMAAFIGTCLFLTLLFWLPERIAAQPPGEARLSLHDALYYCLKGNQDIQISSFIPKQAREDLIEARSVYEPSFFIAGTQDRFLDVESLDINNPTIEDNTDFKAGIKMFLPTGGGPIAVLGNTATG